MKNTRKWSENGHPVNVFTLIIVVALMVFAFPPHVTAAESSLTLEKNEFHPGEKIQVRFIASKNFPQNAWVGIVPSKIPHGDEAENDKHDLIFKYLDGKESGTLTFDAPHQPGQYDFRMNDSDSDGSEVASISFTVKLAEGTLRLDNHMFFTGQEIVLHFTAGKGFAKNAWIGILPASAPHGSETENDKHDVAYQYLQGKSHGTLTFKAPLKPGDYDFRMHDTDNNGSEVATLRFVVKSAEAKLNLEKTQFAPGEDIVVHFVAGPKFSFDAWIGIIPSDVPHGSEYVNDQNDLAYKYLNRKPIGTFTFTAPQKPGSYDVRMNNSDANGVEAASVTFKVVKK